MTPQERLVVIRERLAIIREISERVEACRELKIAPPSDAFDQVWEQSAVIMSHLGHLEDGQWLEIFERDLEDYHAIASTQGMGAI